MEKINDLRVVLKLSFIRLNRLFSGFLEDVEDALKKK